MAVTYVQRGGNWAGYGRTYRFSLYQMQLPTYDLSTASVPITDVSLYQLHIIRCGTLHSKGVFNRFSQLVVSRSVGLV